MNPDDLARENAALRERISAVSAAVLRVGASLDLDTVLAAVLDSARALTGARLGVIVTVDASGAPHDFHSSGLTPDEHRTMETWPDGPRLFAHFRDHPEVLRLPDLRAYAASLGYDAEVLPAMTFQQTPMRHRGAQVGSFSLAGKENGGEFTDEDEKVLVLFASQAAAAVANARTHRDEQRTRADLEALIDTSPVGVVVMDTRGGRPPSLNREAKRIVEGLRVPGRPEQLLQAVTCRFGDGREIALEELPFADVLSGAGKVRAEEIVLSHPDGRTVTTLINATPILGEDGGVESMVVTMQDLAPMQELERLRAEFLNMVSHELRAPLTSIKGSTATVLGAAHDLDPTEMIQFFRIIDEQADHMRGLIGDLLDSGRIDTGTLSVSPQPATVATMVDHARKTFLSAGGRHDVLIDLPPDLPQVMADRRRIVQVLNNLFSNAARHSPGSSPVLVAAQRDGVQVAISVSDRGRGVPAERLPHLFSKYSGAGDPDRAPGAERGVGLGLSICKGLVEAHGGRIWAESAGANRGTRFTFTLPAAEEPAPAPADGSDAHHDRREPARVLVVDDDPQTLRWVRSALTAAGYAPIVTGEPRELADLIRTEKPRLVLLDLMLPETDGIELMERVPELADLPVIFISGYGRDETIARALEVGAADYIVKPFSPTELTARVRAALRRRSEPQAFVSGELAIHYEQRRVTVAGRPVRLTATEFELLRVLSLDAGRVVTYDTLLRRVWRGRETSDTDLVRTMMKKLRRKLGDDPARPAYIVTEHGVGYRMIATDHP